MAISHMSNRWNLFRCQEVKYNQHKCRGWLAQCEETIQEEDESNIKTTRRCKFLWTLGKTYDAEELDQLRDQFGDSAIRVVTNEIKDHSD